MRLPDWCERLWRHSATFSRIAAYIASAAMAAPFIYHIARHSTAYLGLLEDDHFYYTRVADKLATLGKLTYDGTTLTNGFHPLWFGLIAGLRMLCGGLGPAFYAALAIIFLASMILTYELGRRFAERLGASPQLSAAIAAIYSAGTGRLLATGMECVVAVPLFLWWLLEVARPVPVTSRRAALLGFIASLAILGRLDIAIAAAMGVVGYIVLVRPAWSVLWRQLIAFCAGGVLVPLYAAANIVFFGTPLPVSALAKRLVLSPGFNLSYAHVVAFDTYLGPTIGVVLPLGAIFLWQLVRRDPHCLPAARFSAAIALLFAFAFFFLNALSGWIFFGWYAYPLPPAAIAAVVFICQSWTPFAQARQAAVAVMLLLVALAPISGIRYYVQHGPRWSVSDNSLLAMSYELAKRLQQRNGLFAMGAVAGVAAHVADKPILQLEGVITDRRMVEHLRNQDRLEDVLREYHADYLVVSAVGKPPQYGHGCYLLMQPDEQWAGTRTAKMRGEICSEPVEHFFTEAGTNPWSVFPRVETLVWDLRRVQWRGSNVEGAFSGSR
jgi:hypothetical protein